MRRASPRDIPEDSDAKADPLGSLHTVLEGGDDGGNEAFDTGEAVLTHAP